MASKTIKLDTGAEFTADVIAKAINVVVINTPEGYKLVNTLHVTNLEDL